MDEQCGIGRTTVDCNECAPLSDVSTLVLLSVDVDVKLQ